MLYYIESPIRVHGFPIEIRVTWFPGIGGAPGRLAPARVRSRARVEPASRLVPTVPQVQFY